MSTSVMDVKMNELNMDELFPEITDADIKSALNEVAKIGKAEMKNAIIASGKTKKTLY